MTSFMIKKITYLLMSLCFVAGGIKAQQKKFVQELCVGGSFGTTLSKVTFVPKVQEGMLLGYTGGLTVRFDSEKNVGLQAELNFVQQGWKEQYETEPDYEYSRTLNYVEMPFFTHIYFGSRRVKVFINLGPKIGYFIGDKAKSNLNGHDPEGSRPEAHELSVANKLDWGLCGGPGLEFRTGIGYFLLEGRYYYALGDIFKSRKEDYFSKSSSQVISVKLTYLLPVLRR